MVLTTHPLIALRSRECRAQSGGSPTLGFWVCYRIPLPFLVEVETQQCTIVKYWLQMLHMKA
jgi:hypothetical protein